MKSKKLKFALFFTVFTILFSGSTTYAETPEKRKVTFSELVITDPEILYEKAKKKESQSSFSSDLSSDEEETLIGDSGGAILEGESESVELETYSTAQLVEVAETENGTEEVYVENIFVEPTEADFAAASSETRVVGGYKTDPNFYAVRSQATVSYTITYRSDGRRAAKLNYVKSNWTLLDSSVRISNRRYYYANNGSNANGVFVGQKSAMVYTTSNTNTKYAPTSWVSVDMNDYWGCGVNSFATIDRNGSTYSFSYYYNVDPR